ncbi:MAG TPA: glycosyltransferase [Gaiellaceae bacterium]|nr:glycosyltransferase [Gaiellaceae bacterium]
MVVVSVVLPVHDQEAHIRGVVEAYVAALESVDLDFEVILVTNACRDRSPQICEGLAASDHRIHHVPSEVGGWGAAVRRGLEAARGDHLCYTNSARTTPEILTLLLLYAKAYPQVIVKANRRVRDSRRRRLGSLLYNLECRALFDLSVWDINGTPKVFPRTFDRLLALTRDDDLIDAEFAAVCREEGYPLVEVPILATVRYGGKSTTGLGSAVRMYVGAFALWRERRPRA